MHPASKELSIAAVVPATDAPPYVGRCTEALRRTGLSEDAVLTVKGPAGLGPAAARNTGARATDADILLFVDSDVVVRRDVTERVRAAFASDAGLVAVFGSYDDRPAAPGATSGFRNLLHHHVHHRSAGEPGTFWSGLGAVRREAFVAAGGFDAVRYGLASVEDVELGTRLQALGRVVLDPRIQGTHLKRWTLVEMVRTDFARRGVPWTRLLLERRELPATLNLGARHRASVAACVAAALALAAGKPRAASGAVLAMVGLNASLYATIARVRGVREALLAVPLHALHHMTAVAAVAAGLLAHATDA